MAQKDVLDAALACIVKGLAGTRHHLHQHPELSGCEEQTAAFVAARLRALGLAARTGVGGHGVVAELQGGRPGRRIALRADMDALPIMEANDVPYRSQNPGVMHACGHDGHTTMLLGAAEALSAVRGSLAGSVRFLFQPAEETVSGAAAMCADGAMEGVDAVVGLHGWADLPVGAIGIKDGPMMASADTFDLTIQGRGSHAAYPHIGRDPIVAAAQIVLALQTLVSREVDPVEPAVVTVARFHAGTAYNIIPGEARLAGTVRTLNADLRRAMPERVRRVADGICAAADTTCAFEYTWGTPPVLNHPEIAALVARVAGDTLHPENVVALSRPSMGAEDFAEYLAHAPGAMFRLGLGSVGPFHTPTFDFTDAALPVGVELFARIAMTYLEG